MEKSIFIHETSDVYSNATELNGKIIISQNCTITCYGLLKMGKTSFISKNVTIDCFDFICGNNFCCLENTKIGGAGIYSKKAGIQIGNRTFIGQSCFLDVSEGIIIGDEVAVSNEACIYTHNSYLNVLDGFPCKNAPVEIGSNVHIGARAIILPGVKIGDNCVIGAGTIVAKDIPSNSLYIGRNGTEILKRDYYPKPVDKDNIKKILEQIVLEYKERLELVGYNDLILMETNQAIVLTVSQNNVIKIFTEGIISEPPPKDHMYIGVVDDKVLKSWTDTPNFEGYVFDIKNRRIYSDSGFSDLLEDFRNFLRRRGLRFDTDDFYKSISLRDKISLKKIVGNTEG
jgi:maltose O-acetyltransferase